MREEIERVCFNYGKRQRLGKKVFSLSENQIKAIDAIVRAIEDYFVKNHCESYQRSKVTAKHSYVIAYAEKAYRLAWGELGYTKGTYRYIY